MNLVERVKSAIKQRNNFSLSYEGILTANFGDFVPIVVKEMCPTDQFTVDSQAFFRLAPLATPTFGKIHAYINNFYVPNRILMPDNEYEDSMTGGLYGDYPESFPFITYAAIWQILHRITTVGDSSEVKRFRKIFSYLGLGDLVNEIDFAYDIEDEEYDGYESFLAKYNDIEHSISMFPFLALFRIFYDYYAPMNIEEDASFREIYTHKYKGLIVAGTNVEVYSADIQRLSLAFMLLCTCYNKDYFTMAMTRPQRGGASIVPVEIGSDVNPGLSTSDLDRGNSDVIYQGNNDSTGQFDVHNGVVGDNDVTSNNLIGQFKVQVARMYERIQAFTERNNIGGGRFFEQMFARFGVKLSAAELQRSSYLGGKDFWVHVSDVTSQASTDSANLGDMAGKGIAVGRNTSSFTSDDYGFYISILHFVPETFGLVDGIERMWTRHGRFDYWQPEIEDTGMQAVYNKELNRHHLTMANSQDSAPDGVFGYNPRNAEYKTSNPILGGDFVLGNGVYSPQVNSSMNLFRRIGIGDDPRTGAIEVPILSRDFVSILGYDAGHNNFNRVFQNTSDSSDHFFINTQISIGANRPMIGYAEGGLEFAHEDGGNRNVNVAYGGMRL